MRSAAKHAKRRHKAQRRVHPRWCFPRVPGQVNRYPPVPHAALCVATYTTPPLVQAQTSTHALSYLLNQRRGLRLPGRPTGKVCQRRWDVSEVSEAAVAKRQRSRHREQSVIVPLSNVDLL